MLTRDSLSSGMGTQGIWLLSGQGHSPPAPVYCYFSCPLWLWVHYSGLQAKVQHSLSQACSPSWVMLLFSHLSRHFSTELRASPLSPDSDPGPVTPGYSPCLFSFWSLVQFQSFFSLLQPTSRSWGSAAVMSSSLIQEAHTLPGFMPPKAITLEFPSKVKENKYRNLGT